MFKNLKRQLDIPEPISRDSTRSSISASQTSLNSSVQSLTDASLDLPEVHTPKISSTSIQLASANHSGTTEERDARYRMLEQTYNEYRQKTADLISKKDLHIGRLQERVQCLEKRIEGLTNHTNPNALEAERDLLRQKCSDFETAFAEEKQAWQTKYDEMRIQFDRKVSDLEKKNRDCEQERDTLLQKLADVNQKTNTSISDFECTQHELNSLRASLKEWQDFAAEKDLLSKDLQARLETQDAALSKAKAGNENMAAQVKMLQSMERQEMREHLLETREIQSELHISDLTNEVEDLHDALDERHRDLTVSYELLREREQNVQKLEDKLTSLESTGERQRAVIESLQTDLERQKEKSRDVMREKDELLLRNASLSHELETVKRDAKEVRENLRSELNVVSKALDESRAMLQTQSPPVPPSVTLELEQTIKEKDDTIRIQQQRLNELRKTLQKEVKSSRAALSDGDFNWQYMRHVLLRFMTSSEVDALSLVKAVTTLLQLSPEEEQLLRDTLQWKMSWVPGAPKPRLKRREF